MTEHSIPNASTLSGWCKSSYSGGDQGSCIEVLDGYPSGVPVRDSKNPHGPALNIKPSAWTSFVSAIQSRTLRNT
ncbi:DUF397 domain-containing protein [Streptomyces sp. NPDC050564]|uniref:DUF397 domain-containing protein n=1 Tax=Streptomyces sp. NPDC050564 TaxID=3365631 RepID=UPI0037B59843